MKRVAIKHHIVIYSAKLTAVKQALAYLAVKGIYKGNAVELQNLSRPELAIVCKLFGALFYYPPRDFNQFPFGTYFEEDEVETPIKEVNQVLNSFKFTNQDTLQDEHDRLFTIQDDMPAPPWSSMYLDRESILFGHSHKKYCEFIEHCGLGLREDVTDPEDHIGLMLIILGMLIEDEQEQHVKEMLGDYLVTWSGYYFSNLKKCSAGSVYSELADQVKRLLELLCTSYSAQVQIKNNYFHPVKA